MSTQSVWLALSLSAALFGCSGGGAASLGANDLPALLLEARRADAAAPSGESPARAAVRESLRQLLEVEKTSTAEIAKRFQRPELSPSFLLRHESYVGGTFPKGTAALLREVEELEGEYLSELRGFREHLAQGLEAAEVPAEERQVVLDELAGAVAARWQPVVAALEAHSGFVVAAAELYEIIAAQPDSIRATRDGLEFSDTALLQSFGASADAVDEAHRACEEAVKLLSAEQQTTLRWMRQTALARR